MMVRSLECEYVVGVEYWTLHMFFFFKQKTAYEMRISDWSSDVCSSDLQLLHHAADRRGRQMEPRQLRDRPRTHRADDRFSESRGGGHRRDIAKIGRASCRERVCQYV